MAEQILRLRVMAEYGSSGIWVIEQRGIWRHGMIEHTSLGLPTALAARFEAWIERYYARLDFEEYGNFEAETFNQEGRALARELKLFLGKDVYIEYLPELEAGGLGEAEEIT